MKYLFVLVSFVLASAAHASCLSMGSNFWDTLSNYQKEAPAHRWSPLTVVTGVVTGQYSSGLATFAVSSVLQGNAERTLLLDMDGGYAMHASELPTGTSWVLAMSRDPQTGHYAVSVCGVYALRLTGPR